MRRIPGGDLSAPGERQSPKLDGVVDERAHSHGDGRRRPDSESELGRCDSREALRRGEERKYLYERAMHFRAALQNVLLHFAAPTSWLAARNAGAVANSTTAPAFVPRRLLRGTGRHRRWHQDLVDHVNDAIRRGDVRIHNLHAIHV